MRFAVLILFLLKIVAALEHEVPVSLLFSIAKVENKNIFYPYIISINSKRDIEKLKKIGINLKKGRIINCYNKCTCVKAVKLLVGAGITNIDLGTFQINYKYHKLPIEWYFDIKKSAYYASKYIYRIAKKFNKWNWEILAMYHSSSKALNRKYILKVNNYYSQLLSKSNPKLLKEFEKFCKLLKN